MLQGGTETQMALLSPLGERMVCWNSALRSTSFFKDFGSHLLLVCNIWKWPIGLMYGSWFIYPLRLYNILQTFFLMETQTMFTVRQHRWSRLFNGFFSPSFFLLLHFILPPLWYACLKISRGYCSRVFKIKIFFFAEVFNISFISLKSMFLSLNVLQLWAYSYIYIYIYLSLSLSLSLSIYLSISLYLSIYLYITVNFNFNGQEPIEKMWLIPYW